MLLDIFKTRSNLLELNHSPHGMSHVLVSGTFGTQLLAKIVSWWIIKEISGSYPLCYLDSISRAILKGYFVFLSFSVFASSFIFVLFGYHLIEWWYDVYVELRAKNVYPERNWYAEKLQFALRNFLIYKDSVHMFIKWSAKYTLYTENQHTNMLILH